MGLGVVTSNVKTWKPWTEKTENEWILDQALELCRMGHAPPNRDALTETDAQGRHTKLYFIHNPAVKLIKVGISVDVRQRLQTLECATGCELQLLAYHYGSRTAEARLHRYLHRARTKGEWFQESAKLFTMAKQHHQHGIHYVFRKHKIRL